MHCQNFERCELFTVFAVHGVDVARPSVPIYLVFWIHVLVLCIVLLLGIQVVDCVGSYT